MPDSVLLMIHWTFASRRLSISACVGLSTLVLCYGACEFTIAREPGDRSVAIQHNLLELPTSKAAMQGMQQPVSLMWEKKPLREGLTDITKSYRLAIWLDRRIDPSQLVTLGPSADGKPVTLSSVLKAIASQVSAEIGMVENVAYIGPSGTVARVQRAAIELHDHVVRNRGDQQAQMKPFYWPELATPTSILKSIVKQWGIRTASELPHDLLHAGDVGTCNLATQLSLLGSGFELEAELMSNDTVAFKPLGPTVNWQFTYDTASLDSGSLRRQQAQLLREYSGTVRTRRGQVFVDGPTALHVRLQPRSQSATEQDLEQRTWTLEVKNKSTEIVLDTLAQSIGLGISIDAEVSIDKRQRLISFDVAGGGIDVLLQAVAEAAELKIERRGLRVSVTDF